MSYDGIVPYRACDEILDLYFIYSDLKDVGDLSKEELDANAFGDGAALLFEVDTDIPIGKQVR